MFVVPAGTLHLLIQKQLEVAVHAELGQAVGGGQFEKSGVFGGDGGLDGTNPGYIEVNLFINPVAPHLE